MTFFKNFGTTLALLLVGAGCLCGQTTSFDTYFTPQRLRVDLVFAGNAHTQTAYLKQLNREEVWAGSRTTLVSPFGYGEYHCQAFTEDGTLVFSTGFSSLFQEWRTTDQAKVQAMAFNTSVWMPFPKVKLEFEVQARHAKKGTYEPLLRFTIDPADNLINQEQPPYTGTTILYNGPVEKKVDLVFVAEGYTQEQMDKFYKDAERFSGYLFDFEPYKSRKEDFNIWVLPCVSQDSGPDIPQNGIWNRTPLGAAFNTFYVDRYMTAPDFLPLAQAVAGVPFDAIYVIVNTSKYGGGGIYNYYGLSMSDHPTAKAVFVHEFGHSFAGLADEYYTSDVAYNDMYPLDIEPWEPNITTKVDFASKWEDMMDVEGVGLFEGGGYVSKGVFRPADDCRMHTNAAPAYCPVCQRAVSRMIDFYTK